MPVSPVQIEEWVRECIGIRAGAVSLGATMPGATTATIVPAAVRDGSDVVVKIYDHDIPGVGADDVERDAAAMAAAAELELPAPRLLAADPAGDRLGFPALVMTQLAGRPRAHGRPDPDGWVDGLADALIEIAAAPLPESVLPEWDRWFSLPLEIPDWVADPGPWRAMEEALREPILRSPDRFIHRDFHQLNVLWDEGRVSGTVDWVNGCLGPIESDIARARLNIALADDDPAGFAHADRFLDRCLRAGLPWDAKWDLEFVADAAHATEAALVGADLGAALTLDGVRRVFDQAVRRALAAAERA